MIFTHLSQNIIVTIIFIVIFNDFYSLSQNIIVTIIFIVVFNDFTHCHRIS